MWCCVVIGAEAAEDGSGSDTAGQSASEEGSPYQGPLCLTAGMLLVIPSFLLCEVFLVKQRTTEMRASLTSKLVD